MNLAPLMLIIGTTLTDLASATSRETAFSPIVELRQYTLKPGRRDDLIQLFENHFVEGQEILGASIIGQFRDLRDPDRFVWLRGFSTMEARQKALEGFYSGPIWREHRAAANDTMIDSDNVLLLRAAGPESGFHLDPARRPLLDAPETFGGVVCATLYYFSQPIDSSFTQYFEEEMVPVLRKAGAPPRAKFVTELSKNTFPRLPVREGENVMIWFASFADAAAYANYRSRLENDSEWMEKILPELKKRTIKTETLELAPCRRSLFRHHLDNASAVASDHPLA